MGWKTFKDYFKIGHQVTISGDYLSIDSPLKTGCARIELKSGKIVDCKINGDKTFLKSYYPLVLNASQETIINLLSKEDTFSNSTKVYTIKDDKIVEQYAEEYGWPNTTHCGEQMYENTHFLTRREALEKAISNLKAGVSLHMNERERLKDQMEPG